MPAQRRYRLGPRQPQPAPCRRRLGPAMGHPPPGGRAGVKPYTPNPVPVMSPGHRVTVSLCHPAILPGRTVGILGGGQLGRMFAIAARRLGYRVHAFDPTRDGPTGQVADVEVCAAYDDLEAARRFAANVDVVTFEFENIPAETLRVIAETRPVHPSPEVLHVCRHRLREKDFLKGHGFPVAPYRSVASVVELYEALAQLGTPAILKTADFGYDGKGQARLDD